MLKPAYKLTIGEKSIDVTHEAKESTVVDVMVSLDLDTPADSFTVVLGRVNGLKAARGDETKLDLGYADDGGLTRVMSGTVAIVESNLTTKRVIGLAVTQLVLRSFAGQTYEGKTAGAIVRDLADKAKVEVARAEDGITFPAYVIDEERSFYHHMRELAYLCGFDLYIDADGKLVFEKFGNGKTVHTLEYAKHIVALDVVSSPPRAGRVEAWGESPTGSQGDDAWGWLTKDFSSSKGTAGTGAPLLRLSRSALRTAAAARSAADAIHIQTRRRMLRGRSVTVGRPEVKLGDAIQLRSFPDQSLNKTFQVRSIVHRITKRDGFTTAIDFRALQT